MNSSLHLQKPRAFLEEKEELLKNIFCKKEKTKQTEENKNKTIEEPDAGKNWMHRKDKFKYSCSLFHFKKIWRKLKSKKWRK